MKRQIVIRRPRLLIALVILNSLVLTGIVNIHPVVGMLNDLDRTNFDYSPLNALQIVETDTKIVSPINVFSLDNCNGRLTITEQMPSTGIRNNPLNIAISKPFDSDDARRLLENKYKPVGWGRGGGRIIRLTNEGVMTAVPGTNMQYKWRVEEQQSSGYIEFRGRSGRSTYTMRRWLSWPEIVSSKNLGYEF